MKIVKLSKLWGGVRRELVANPKKAVVLAVLLAAAAWFWGPNLWRKLGGHPTTAAGTPPVAPAASIVATPQAASHHGGYQNRQIVSWSQLLAARQQNPLTRPAAFDPTWPQPFKVPQKDDGTSGEGSTSEGHTSALLTPAEVGLVLESILYGKSNRAAVINGEIYREGSEVTVATTQGGSVNFHLVAIERTSVALERYGRTYWLEFPRPKIAAPSRNDRPHEPTKPSQQHQP